MPLLDPLFNHARWLTHNKEKAEDLVQETYVKALKGFPSFEQGTNFRAWMYRILRNTFLTSRTGLETKMTVAIDEGNHDAVVTATTDRYTPEAILIDRDHQELLEAALVELPLHLREVVLLCE